MTKCQGMLTVEKVPNLDNASYYAKKTHSKNSKACKEAFVP